MERATVRPRIDPVRDQPANRPHAAAEAGESHNLCQGQEYQNRNVGCPAQNHMDDSQITLPPSGTRGSGISRPLRLVFKALSPMGTLMFRMGRKIQGRPLARLESVGARSGKTRRVILGTFPGGHPDSSVIVASNGGSASHPGWAYNLAANPNQVRIDTGEGLVAAEVELLEPEERDRMWNQVVEMAPGYRSYTEKTDREIPLFRLTPLR